MGHTYANVLIHVAFGTKGRLPMIAESFRSRLHQYMGGVARKELGRALSIGGTDDHVHGLLSISPTIPVSQAMSKWKSLSSGWVHKTVPEATDFAWQSGYGAFSVSQSHVDAVVRYIERQAEHHRKRSFQEEFIELLRRHGIEHDPSDVWG